MSAQYTPGPWTTDGSARGGDLDIIAPSGRVALIDCEPRGDFQSEVVLESNARLIAAAPDLLIALEACLHRLAHHDDQSVPECEMAQAAIAKAVGSDQ
jgi:hypothetical protein